MATRLRDEEEPERLVAEPEAVARLTAMVNALPDDSASWWYVNSAGHNVPIPAAMAFWDLVGLTAFAEAGRVFPDRAKYLGWLLDPYGSPFGCDDEEYYGVITYAPHLYPSKFGGKG